MSTIEEIDRRVRELTGEATASIPFLCHGSPTECDVVLVGINPGSETPFLPYWKPNCGCDKDGWLADYLQRYDRFKPTRDRIEVLCRAIAPLKCLELNLWQHYSKNEMSLEKQYKDTALFDFMFEAVRPRILIVHGNAPLKHMTQTLGLTLNKDQLNPSTYLGQAVDDFVSKRHFAYVSRDYVSTVGL